MSKISDEIRNDSEMVELPKDADGNPMHLRDKIYDLNGYEHAVISLHLYNGFGVPTWMVGIGFGNEVSPRDLTHERHDSFERIADELDDWTAVLADCDVDAAHKFAERIRKLAEKEGE